MLSMLRGLAFGLLAAAPFAASSFAQSQQPVYPVVEDLTSDIRLIKVAPNVAVEQLRGDAALAHLRNVMARHPHAFDEAVKRLTSRGRTDTGVVFVERTLHNAAASQMKNRSSDYSLTQTSSETSADGEVDFWSWDGPGDEWEGNIYVEVYGYGASTWSGAIDTGTTSYPWVYVDETWASPDCSPHCGPDNQGGRLNPLMPGQMTHGAIQLAALRRGNGVFMQADWNSWYNWSECFQSRVVGGCTAAAVGCLRLKAGWPACFGFTCVGVEIGSAIGCAL